MPTEVQNHVNRLTMEVESKVQNPHEDATVYINCAVYENGLLESSTTQTIKCDELRAEKKLHFIEKPIQRTVMAKEQENIEFAHMNGDCTADELQRFEQGPYVAKTRVFQTQEIRITKIRKPLAAKVNDSVDANCNKATEAQRAVNNTEMEVETKICRPTEENEPEVMVQNEVPVVQTEPVRLEYESRVHEPVVRFQEPEVQSVKHKHGRSSAEEPPRKKRYLCKDIVIPANGALYRNEGLTYPTTKLRLEARSWSLPKGSNPESDSLTTPEECLLTVTEDDPNADRIAEIVYMTFRPRVQKDKHVRLLFPPPYHPKDPEPEVQVTVVPPVEEKPEEMHEENNVGSSPVEEDDDITDGKLSKRGRKKRNWFQRMWHNLRSGFRSNDHRHS